MINTNHNKNNLFNSPIEIGMRVLLILAQLHPDKLDLDNLAFFDYVITYSEDFDGPENLHPPVPNRLAELAMRREKMQKGLKLLISKEFIEPHLSKLGNHYKITMRGSQFLSCLSSPYYKKLWERAHWISDSYHHLIKHRKDVYNMGI